MHKGSSAELSVVSLRGSKEDKEKKKAKMRKMKKEEEEDQIDSRLDDLGTAAFDLIMGHKQNQTDDGSDFSLRDSLIIHLTLKISFGFHYR